MGSCERTILRGYGTETNAKIGILQTTSVRSVDESNPDRKWGDRGKNEKSAIDHITLAKHKITYELILLLNGTLEALCVKVLFMHWFFQARPPRWDSQVEELTISGKDVCQVILNMPRKTTRLEQAPTSFKVWLDIPQYTPGNIRLKKEGQPSMLPIRRKVSSVLSYAFDKRRNFLDLETGF